MFKVPHALCDPQNTYRNCFLACLFLALYMQIVYRNFVSRVPHAPCDPQNLYRNCSLASLFLAPSMQIAYRNFVFRVPHAPCDPQNTFRNYSLESLFLAPRMRIVPRLLGLRPRAPLERFGLSVVIMDDGSGGAPAPPHHPPRLLGLRPRAPLERFAFRSLNHHQFVEPLKTKFLYTSRMRGPKKRGSREQFLYVFCGSKAPKLPPGPVTRILDFDPTPLP